MTTETDDRPASRKTLVDIAGFASSQYALRFAYVLRAFLVARILGPVGNGIWQHFMLVFEYAQHSHCGLLPGLSKHLGHVIGRGDEVAALDAQRSGAGGVVLCSSLLLIGILGYVAFDWQAIHPVDRWGVPLVGLIVVIEQLTMAYKAQLRAYSRIGIISRVSFGFALSNFLVSVLLLIVLPHGFKMFGLVIGWLVTRMATTGWLLRASGLELRLELDPAALRILFVTGFPIFLFHLSQAALRNIDRVLVDMVLEKEDLGVYGIAVSLATLVRFATEAIAFVIYPIFLRKYGETRDPAALRRHLEEPTAFLAIWVPLALGLSYLVLHLPVLWLLPRFVPSIEIFRLLTVSAVFSCLATLPGFYLMAIDRQNALVPIGFLTVGLNYLLGHQLIAAGYGMVGVAAATSFALFLYSTVILLFSGRFTLGSWGGSTGWVARIYVPTAYMAAVIVGLRWGVPRTSLAGWGETPRALAEGGAFLALAAPLAIRFERGTSFLRNWLSRPPTPKRDFEQPLPRDDRGNSL
jgi:O-antigen/teichoic acid export membrane protein